MQFLLAEYVFAKINCLIALGTWFSNHTSKLILPQPCHTTPLQLPTKQSLVDSPTQAISAQP